MLIFRGNKFKKNLFPRNIKQHKTEDSMVSINTGLGNSFTKLRIEETL